ncbi:hypothetical protein AMS68_005757 [Peltaster fructicola]|uniref:U-box domain-containing protein n=1 Tax=Peltaster fructicola TaxID=286661 RepID=A0A6H0Y0R0_9PEZI|nr:hypothetical protein AMS68_005757 [Peltaster fructicola]
MADVADTLKERGNSAFKEGRYAQAELRYSEAIGHHASNYLIYNNRALVRLKLQNYDGVVDDCLKSIGLARRNHKAYYFLAQAQLALHRPNEALSSALTAYEQVRNPAAGVKSSTADLESFSSLVLKCKKAKFAKREQERLRLRGDLRAEIEELLEQGRQDDLAKITRRVDALELQPVRATQLSQDVQSDHERKLAELRTVFLLADPTNPPQREIPDHLVDMITFEPMHDPVMTKNGHSYERATIHEHLKRSPTDPLTREPLTIQELRPNFGLKAACDAFWESGASEWITDW